MECQFCHTPLKPGTLVCPTCQRPVAADPEATLASAPTAVAAPPAQRPQPDAKSGGRALFMNFNQSPAEIVRVMDETQQKVKDHLARRKKYVLLLWLLFPLGLPFVFADVALGYNICTFSLVALTLWAGAIFGLVMLRRQGKMTPFGPKYELARTIFDTLRDDVSPKRTMTGWLDLTGAQQESKKMREKTSASGQPIHYYRDEWLRLKTSLYDGNVLRVSLMDRVKARQGFWKRGRSGKRKYRSGSSQSEAHLEFSVSVDTSHYTVQPFDRQVTNIPSSRFVIQQAEAGEGRVAFSAAAASGQFDAWDILNALRFGYDHIQPLTA
ncbi:MAG: hypothetical protein HS126_33070 [Anaerolineales bacterium]|nr:hypothetical protein [Anaerolineales bacterium]